MDHSSKKNVFNPKNCIEGPYAISNVHQYPPTQHVSLHDMYNMLRLGLYLVTIMKYT